MRRWTLPLLLLAGGCTVGPAYQSPPTLPTGASGAFLAQSPWIDPLAPLPDRWWRLYDDPVLDDLIARAFVANTDIRVAIANLKRARAIADEARGGRSPSTDVSAGASYGQGTSDIGQIGRPGGGTYLSFGGGASVAWEIDLFGRAASSVAAARADVEATEAVRDAVRTTVAAETARAYLASCALAETAAIIDQSLDNSRQTLDATAARVRVGNAAALDADRAAIDIENSRAARFDVDGQRRVALLELTALIGATPGGLPSEASVCRALPELSQPLPVETAAALMKRRPDIRAAERRLAADTARVGVATAELYPQISIVGSAAYAGDRSASRNSLFSFSLGPLFSWSFPNQAIGRARVRQADAQAEAALARFDGEVVLALKDVEQQLTRYLAERARSDALGAARERAEAAFAKTGHRHRMGTISFLDLLVAQRELIATRSAYAGSRERLAARQIDLFKALGGGWADAAAADGSAGSPVR